MPSKPVSFVPNKPRSVPTLEEKMARWGRQRNAVGVDWRAVSATTLRTALHLCLNEGWSLTFQPTRDGGAVAIKLWNGGPEKREYAADATEVSELLESLIELLNEGSEDVRLAMSGGAD